MRTARVLIIRIMHLFIFVGTISAERENLNIPEKIYTSTALEKI